MHKGLFSNPAGKADGISPSDSATFSPVYRALWVGGAGNVAVVPEGQDTSVVFWGVQDGSVLPVAVKKVLSTGTTATNILGLR